MPGPGRKPAIEATLRIPPRLRMMESANRSDKSVKARILTAIIPSCSARSSSTARPINPKPALLTTYSTSTPSAARAAAIFSPASAVSRSHGITIGALLPVAAISAASALSRASRRATIASRWPLEAKTRASSAPIPAEAPVISVPRSVTIFLSVASPSAYAFRGDTACLQAFRNPERSNRRNGSPSGWLRRRTRYLKKIYAGRPTRRRVMAGQRLTAGNRETLPGSDTMLEIKPVAGGYPQQIGRAPNHIVLELAHLAVGINEFPHHLDDAQAAPLIHRTHDHAREMIEVDRLTFDQRCGCDQFVGCSGIEPEAAFDQAMQLAFFDLGRFAVERDDVDEQGGGGQNITRIVEITRLAPGCNDIGDELTQSVEHEGSLIGFEGYMA